MAVAQISRGQAYPLASNPGYYLRKDAAQAWDRATVDFGKTVLISGAVRYYDVQLEIFEDRYRRGNLAGRAGYTNDVRWWPAKGSYYTRRAGTAAAAVPGTSNHGGGVAVDVKTSRSAGDPGHDTAVVWSTWNDADRTRFLKVAAEHGWDDDEGRQVNEVWHLTYYPARDKHRGQAVPKKETFLMALSNREQETLADTVRKLEVIARRSEDRQREMIRGQRELTATNRAQAAAMEELAKSVGVDPKVVTKAVTAAVQKSLTNLEVTLTNEEK